MDRNFNIYRDAEGKVSEADKARLDGFLAGRAEADAEARRELLAQGLELARTWLDPKEPESGA